MVAGKCCVKRVETKTVEPTIVAYRSAPRGLLRSISAVARWSVKREAKSSTIAQHKVASREPQQGFLVCQTWQSVRSLRGTRGPLALLLTSLNQSDIGPLSVISKHDFLLVVLYTFRESCG